MAVNRAGTTYIVTGGGSGLGLAAVKELHKEGANVAIFDRISEDEGEELVQRLGGQGAERLLFQSCDVTDRKVVEESVARVVEHFGGLHGVINSAGVGSVSQTVERDGTPLNPGIFDFVVQVNLYGTFNLASVCAAAMAQMEPTGEDAERGVIINVASVAAYDGQKGQVPYSASKGAVVSMTLPMARDLGRHGIRVVCIAPGIMDTPMMQMTTPKVQKNLLRSVAYPKRFGHVEEFAHLVTHIIDNRYLNGETIRFDGGIRMSNL